MSRLQLGQAMLAVLAALPLASGAEVRSASADGFVIVESRRVEAARAKVYAALPAVDRWWNAEHSYSGSAANLSLKAEAGGCFCERWNGGEVEHGRVIMALRDQVLRLQASLGPLQGRAVNGVLTFQLKPDEGSGGKATSLTLTYAVNGASGSALDKSAPAVDSVLREQLERLARYVETGNPSASQ
jgi:uncharacterized protein YndB with AHSA1/START domain